MRRKVRSRLGMASIKRTMADQILRSIKNRDREAGKRCLDDEIRSRRCQRTSYGRKWAFPGCHRKIGIPGCSTPPLVLLPQAEAYRGKTNLLKLSKIHKNYLMVVVETTEVADGG